MVGGNLSSHMRRFYPKTERLLEAALEIHFFPELLKNVFLSHWFHLQVFEGLLQHQEYSFTMVSNYSDLLLKKQAT